MIKTEPAWTSEIEIVEKKDTIALWIARWTLKEMEEKSKKEKRKNDKEIVKMLGARWEVVGLTLEDLESQHKEELEFIESFESFVTWSGPGWMLPKKLNKEEIFEDLAKVIDLAITAGISIEQIRNMAEIRQVMFVMKE